MPVGSGGSEGVGRGRFIDCVGRLPKLTSNVGNWANSSNVPRLSVAVMCFLLRGFPAQAGRIVFDHRAARGRLVPSNARVRDAPSLYFHFVTEEAGLTITPVVPNGGIIPSG